MIEKNEMIFGVRAVIEAIQAGIEIDKVLIKMDIQSDLSKELFAVLKDTFIPVQRVPVERINRITKELYPGIARKFGSSASKVERAMRHAIDVAWSRGRLDSVNRIYGYKVFSAEDKPTNGEFIALIADKLSMRQTA